MAQPLKNFVRDNRKLADIFALTKKYGFSLGDCETPAHSICQELIKQLPSKKLKESIDVVEVLLSYADIINHMDGKIPFKPIDAGQSSRTSKKAPYVGFHWMSLFDYFDYMFSEQKIIFLRVGIDDYGAEKYKEKKSEMIAHGTVAILIPTRKRYKMFYINSHGQDLRLIQFYDFPLTKTRDRHIKLDEPIDTYVMKFIVQKYNRRDVDYQIEYNCDEKDTYYGANLQAGDLHGICYLFPYIIYYYFCHNYNKKRNIDDITLPTVRSMLMSGNINRFVHSCFTEFDTTFKGLFIENIKKRHSKKKCIDTLENYITERETYFVKKICNATLSYMTQAYYIEKIKN